MPAAHRVAELTNLTGDWSARAYFLSSSEEPENLVRAEASLNELISSVESSEHVRTLTASWLRNLNIPISDSHHSDDH